jgi:transaldolase
MSESYFRRIAATTPTRLWINNPTGTEIGLALGQGAVGCTTNPSYSGSLLQRESTYVRGVIESTVAENSGADEPTIAERVQLRLVARITEGFRGVYEGSAGKAGYVSIQGSPLVDGDAEAILRSARGARQMAPNVALKIPATLSGLVALEGLVEDGSPCIVTEVFSIAQLIEANNRYLGVVARTGVSPPFFISPITGIFADHLRKVAARDGIVADPEAVAFAGVALARRCYAVATARSYPATLLFGGARSPEDFTGLVGGPTAATINYSTVEEIVSLDPPVEATIEAPVRAEYVTELRSKFADFERAWQDRGLGLEEFDGFGPVQHFRGSFVAAWEALLAAVRETRSATSVA